MVGRTYKSRVLKSSTRAWFGRLHEDLLAQGVPYQDLMPPQPRNPVGDFDPATLSYGVDIDGLRMSEKKEPVCSGC